MLNIDDFVSKLNTYVEDESKVIEEIKKLRESKIKIESELVEATQKEDEIQSKISADVANALDESGKNKFSNAEKRDAEKKRLLGEDKEYQKLLDSIKTEKDKLRQHQNNFEYQLNLLSFTKDKQANIRAILNALSEVK